MPLAQVFSEGIDDLGYIWNLVVDTVARLLDERTWSALRDHFSASGIFPVLLGVVLIIVLGWIWWLIGLVLGGTSVGWTRVLANRLAKSLRRREPLAAALTSMRSILPLVLGLRIAGAARSLERGEDVSLVGALRRQRLLPAQILALAASAERIGSDALASVLALIARDALTRERLGRRFVPAVATMLAIALLGSFIGLYIIPRISYISQEEHVAPTAHFAAWTWCTGHLLTIIVPGIVCLIAAGSYLAWRLHWRWQRRRIAAEILLVAASARLDEAAIAASLGLSDASTGFAGLCASTGWQARDPIELARAVRRAQERNDRLRIVLATVFEIASPVLLGLLVLLMCHDLFGWLVHMIFEEGKFT